MNAAKRTDPKFLSMAWHAHADLSVRSRAGRLLMLTGAPATGKTTWARVAGERATGRPPVCVSGSPETEESNLFGRWTLVGDETRFVDGPLPAALKSERWLTIEEFSLIPIEVRSALMPLRDQKEISNPQTGEIIPVPESFRLIATSNNENLSCRKNAGIARVLYDGFVILDVPELLDADVARWARNDFPMTAKKEIDKAIALWNGYRSMSEGGSEGRSALSYRALSHYLALRESGMDGDTATRIALVNKFMPTDPDLYSAAKTRLLASAAASDDGEVTDAAF